MENETMAEDDEQATDALDDLRTDDEQAAQTVGGVRVGKLLGVNY